MRAKKRRRRIAMPVRERQFKHILESYLDRGFSLKVATHRAAATVNKYRSELSRGKRVCRGKKKKRSCRVKRGPQLIGRGGSRRQWYPGKGRVSGRERFACLEHGRRFKTRAAMLAHYRSH